MVAPFLSILLLTYHQATTWLPLYPWNDVARYSRTELLLEAGINGCLMLNYESRFGRTVKLIPHRAGKRTPDANHIVLHAITVVAALPAFADRLK